MNSRAWLPLKLRLLAGRSGRGNKSLSAIARKYSGVGVDGKKYYQSTPALQKRLGHIIHGKCNTPHLVKILENEWALSICEIRAIVEEDRVRNESGNPITLEEAQDFYVETRVKEMISLGKPEEQARIMANMSVALKKIAS